MRVKSAWDKRILDVGGQTVRGLMSNLNNRCLKAVWFCRYTFVCGDFLFNRLHSNSKRAILSLTGGRTLFDNSKIRQSAQSWFQRKGLSFSIWIFFPFSTNKYLHLMANNNNNFTFVYFEKRLLTCRKCQITKLQSAVSILHCSARVLWCTNLNRLVSQIVHWLFPLTGCDDG